MGLGTQQALNQVNNDFETSSSDNSTCCGSSESSSSLLPEDSMLLWTKEELISEGLEWELRKENLTFQPSLAQRPPKESLTQNELDN